MADKDVVIVTTRDALPQARSLASLLEMEGMHGIVVVGEEGLPQNLNVPVAVIIWAPDSLAYSFYKDCQRIDNLSILPFRTRDGHRAFLSRKQIKFLMVLPSSEPATFEVNSNNPNEVYLLGKAGTREILLRLKQILGADDQAPRVRAEASKARESSQGGRVVTVFSAKGGVGKTAISTNLAVAIHEGRAKKTLLVDGDLQFGDTAVWLGLTPKASMVDLLERGMEIDEVAVRSTVQEHESGLHVLLPPEDPATAELVRPEVMRALIGILRQMYEFVVIDTHTSYGEETLAALDTADDIVLVVTPEVSVVRNTNVFLGLCQVLGYSDKLTAILNRANTGVQRSRLPEDIRRLVKAEVVSDGRSMVWSLNMGKPIVQEDKTLPIVQGINALADVLAGPALNARKRGWQHILWPFGSQNGKPNGAPEPAASH